MDHRGPEHHYDEVECPECGSFFQQGELQPETVKNNCPECGYDINSATGGRPYRGQPSHIRSEMTERNTPLDGASSDRGGNPLAEGILASYDPLGEIEREEKGEEGKVCPACNVGRLKPANGTNGPHYRCDSCNNRFRNEEIEADPSATEPAGLGETHPVQDSTWPRGDLTGRPARDEMLGSVRNAAFGDDEEAWEEIIKEFEGKLPEPATPAGKMRKEIKELEAIPTATWLEGTEHDSSVSNFPVEHLGWDIVDVVEPSKELTEAANKYSMPFPEGITDNLHEALIKLNAWVENPEENGKLRPYKQYWSVIRPKISEGSVKIGVEDPIMADIINDVARTDSLSALDKTSSLRKEALPAALLEAIPAIGAGAAELLGGLGLGEAASGAASRILPWVGKKMVQNFALDTAKDAIMGDGNDQSQGNQSQNNDSGGLFGMYNDAVDAMTPDIPTGTMSLDLTPTQFTGKVATYGDEYEHPSSITRRIEDPVNGGIDPHQRTDKSNDDWAYDMLDVNEIGQAKDNRGTDDAKEQRKRVFADNNHSDSAIFDDKQKGALESFFELFPLVEQFANSNESGLNDPIMRSLHETLEDAFPGYLDFEEPVASDSEILLILTGNPNEKKEASGPGFDLGTGFDGQVTPTAPDATMTPTPKKPNVTDPSTHGFDPQAGPASAAADTPGWDTQTAPNLVNNSQPLTPQEQQQANQMTQKQKQQQQQTQQQIMQQVQQKKKASDTQGPHTDEQQAAVAELLIQMGREEEIPNMLENPYEYAKELAEIQNKGLLTNDDPKENAPQPAAPPMPNQGMPPGMPPMGAPDPMNAPPPGAPQMLASVSSSMLKSAAKHGADSIAGKCPKCDSHTTKMIQQDGTCKCHTCGHEWKDDSFKAADGHSSDLSSTATYHDALAKIAEGAPVDSFTIPEDEPLEIDDSSHTWEDSNGEPLQEGKEYEIYAHTYDIPDIGRVLEIKPDSIVYEIESDGGLRTTIEIDRKESALNGYRFTPVDESSENNPSGIEENMDSKPVPVPGETTDLSTPHIQVGSKTAGKHYTPMEQRELIDEYGEARNSDKLNLEGTHYAEADDDYFLFGC